MRSNERCRSAVALAVLAAVTLIGCDVQDVVEGEARAAVIDTPISGENEPTLDPSDVQYGGLDGNAEGEPQSASHEGEPQLMDPDGAAHGGLQTICCYSDCDTVSRSGTGNKIYQYDCSFPNSSTHLLGSGCNTADGAAADVWITSNRILDVDTVECQAYHTTAGSFDLEACCITCKDC